MEDLKKLVVEFFKRLNCEILENEIIEISKIPIEFENIYGKKGPYKFSFNEKNNSENIEIVTTSSYLITAISEYLKDRAKSTLLQIKFKENIFEEITKIIDFQGYNIENISTENQNDLIYKLTFITNLQYINKNEKVINTLYFHNGEIINNFNIKNYNTAAGNRNSISDINFENEIKVAKVKIRDLIKDKIDLISTDLFFLLEKSRKKIEIHYNELVNETNFEIEKNIQKIKELDKEKIEGNIIKISKLRETNNKLCEKINPEKIEKEKKFHYEDGRLKHSLNISSNILNMTVIYYPIHNLTLDIKSRDSIKRINFNFNPLIKKISGLKCETCHTQINKITLCSNNHLTCINCSSKCNFCYYEVCKKCYQLNCNQCNISACSKCIQKCHTCKRNFCGNHLSNDFMEGFKICNKCSLICSSCNKSTSKNLFRNIKGKNLCPRCIGMSINFYD